MMRTLFSIAAFLAAVWAVRDVGLEWRDAAIVADLEPPRASEQLPSLAREIDRVGVLAAETTETGRAHARLGALLRRAAEDERDRQQRISLFCRALSAYGVASVREPHHATYLVQWANLRQLLGTTECPEPYTQGDFSTAARAALAADPTDTRVLYAAAQLASWSNDAVELRRRLNSFLTLKTELRPHELEFVYRQLRSREDIAAIVPPRFPHVLTWSALLRERNPDLFAGERATLGGLQAEAVNESEQSLAREQIDGALHQRRLLALADLAATDAVRQMVDRQLAEQFRRASREVEAAYFADRAGLFEGAVVRAVMKSDTRPTATAVRSWGFDEVVEFDDFYTSLGVYVPVGFAPRIIQLLARSGGSTLDPSQVRVLVSNDNRDWIELGDRAVATPVSLAGRAGVVVRIEGAPYRYWKVHFSSADRSGLFRNSLADLIKVYGVRWNE